MLKLKFIVPALLIVLAGCSQKIRTQAGVGTAKNQGDSLYVEMGIKAVIKAGEKVELKFTVHNDGAVAKSFCKWHTPFEPLMSRYLDVVDEQGNEAPYKGAMAKRIMPPPADSYVMVKAQDKLTGEVDLVKAYELVAGKKYTVSYNSGGISGLKTVGSVTFSYVH